VNSGKQKTSLVDRGGQYTRLCSLIRKIGGDWNYGTRGRVSREGRTLYKGEHEGEKTMRHRKFFWVGELGGLTLLWAGQRVSEVDRPAE